MSSYFPMTGFRATVCASTVCNRYDSAPTRCNTVHGKTFQLHKRNNQLSIRMTYLLTITLRFRQYQAIHTLIYKISLGVDAV